MCAVRTTCTRFRRDSNKHTAQLVERRTGTPLTQVRFPGAARDFSPRVNFQSRLSYGVRTPPCAIACIYICVRVKNPVDHVKVRWITETLKHPARTEGWVARLCRSWLSLEKTTRISYGKFHYDHTVVSTTEKVTSHRTVFRYVPCRRQIRHRFAHRLIPLG